MKTGLILASVALIIFIALSFISRLYNHKKDLFEFELDDLRDTHYNQWFWNNKLQFAYRLALYISFGLFTASVVILSLTCFPEYGLSWEFVLLRLEAAFITFFVAGWILIRVANAIAYAIPISAILVICAPLMLFEHLCGRD